MLWATSKASTTGWFDLWDGERSEVSTSNYGFPENASRLNAVSRKRCSSIRWVCLFPVAGAAVDSRPAYLKHTRKWAETDTVQTLNWNRFSGPNELTRQGGRGWRLYGCGAWRSRNNPGSCALPGTTSGQHLGIDQSLLSPDQMGTVKAEEREKSHIQTAKSFGTVVLLIFFFLELFLWFGGFEGSKQEV